VENSDIKILNAIKKKYNSVKNNSIGASFNQKLGDFQIVRSNLAG
jgi:hypothetical protein